MKAQLGWSGAELQMDPQEMLRQPIEFRTPQDCGPPVDLAGNTQFRLHLQPKDDWLEWKSSLPVGPDPAPEGHAGLPRPLGVQFQWRRAYRPLVSWEKTHGLALPLAHGLLAPTELLRPRVSEASLARVSFRVDGKLYPRKSPRYREVSPGLTFMELTLQTSSAAWPLSEIAHAPQPVDVWVLVAPGDRRAIDRSRLRAARGRWQVDRVVGCQQQWHGAPVVSRDRTAPSYRKVIGVLCCPDGADSARVVPFPHDVADRLKARREPTVTAATATNKRPPTLATEPIREPS